ncbi:MAG: alpha-L-rhamnosidase C-terminal domain-containing protein, partial [Eubacteriales bacterium]|nr:alpha-L-rhamnosidase C-terminal domain-containing protein [Eubacteriales bacterium]
KFLPTDERAGIYGVDSPRGGHRLAIEGEGVSTGVADYRCYLDGSFYLTKPKIIEFLGAIQEKIDFRKLPEAWKRNAAISEEWEIADVLFDVAENPFLKAVGMRNLLPYNPSPIPSLKEIPGTFAAKEVQEDGTILLDAKVHTNAYVRWHFLGGEGSTVKITYLEELLPESCEWSEGLTDTIVLAEKETIYEPFWYRTFRYVKVQILPVYGTKEETVREEAVGEEAFREEVSKEDAIQERSTAELKEVTFHKTGYPLEVKTKIHSLSPWVEQVWDICVRTLENCMMDTYMDCPFYEEMQYPMDTRLQAAFTYAVSADSRLPKKALYDFHRAKTPSGLIPGKAPTGYMQVISTFSLHYIMMMREYFVQTGDTKTLYELRSDVDSILEYFASKIREEDGLMGDPGYWAFVDWQDQAWSEHGGVPTALLTGGSALISLLYGYTLLCAAEIFEATGRPYMAEEYRERQKQIVEAVENTCWDSEREMYREGPAHMQFTQHTQSWAVLNGMKKGKEAAALLQKTLTEPDVIRCSFSTSNEFFRAAQMADAYELTDSMMEQWRQLPARGLTTCPEVPVDGRSLCHAWSALPIYEITRAMAGIKATKPGWEEFEIQPNLVGVKDLSGEVVTPIGMIGFRYEEKEDGNIQVEVDLPEGSNGYLRKKNGERQKLTVGKNLLVIENTKM